MGVRRKARECALQILYFMDVCKIDNEVDEEFSLLKENRSPKILRFVNKLVEGTVENIVKIDVLITKYADNWELERMAAVDRNILRSASYEIIYLTEIPISVIINEAVELAKKYSTAESGKFINGILDKLKEERIKKRK
ncbi:transcription antitermination factor NusB [bacterium]|nr:transcription antitermination factor NusB [bacterium]